MAFTTWCMILFAPDAGGYIELSSNPEFAEQEAEERMRDKAIEAFCKDCPIYSIQTSNGGNCPDCSALNAFKQRLNEE